MCEFKLSGRRQLLTFSVHLLLLAASLASSNAQVSVLTRNYNNLRTGTNISETTLNSSNVNSNSFGQLFQLPVDDTVYAGLLYAANLTIAGGVHNVLFVATTNNSVYAFDADLAGPPLWQRNFNGTGRPSTNLEVGTGPNSYCVGSYMDIQGDIGIVSTPVIDGTNNTMFFVTRDVEAAGTVQRLHAINILTGNENANSPTVLKASVSGTGQGGNVVNFSALMQNQRAGLALSNNAVYITWAAFCDNPPYNGWVMSYDENSLTQLGVFNTTPNGNAAGIWMGGAAPAIDSAGNVYLSDGNGSVDDKVNYGDSILKLAPRTLALVDYFTPTDYNNLNTQDLDIASGGPNFLPGTQYLVQGSKQGIVFVLNSSNLGHLNAGTQNPESFQAVNVTTSPTETHHIHNTCIPWNSPEGMNLYVWGENDNLRAYRFNGSNSFTTPSFATGSILPPLGMPGGMMSLSSNGANVGTGVLWASVPLNGDANHAVVPGILYAFNAETLALLWSSSAPADNPGMFAKFNPPIAVNGKVYLASFSNLVSVYGLKNAPPYQAVAAISAGGAASGSFSGDADFNGGSTAGSNSNVDLSAVIYPAPEQVYDYQRYGNFTYTIPKLTAGSAYTVRLHFAETYFTQAAQRLFNVTINGNLALTNFDIIAVAGAPNKAIIEPFAATANGSGQIVIQFISVYNYAMVNGIEVIAGNSLMGETAVAAAGPASGVFKSDQYYSGGAVAVPTTAPVNVSAVTNPAPQSVYQHERYGNFTYTIPGLVSMNGYTVRLHFAETYWPTPNSRLFNVLINGKQVLTNFDIFAASGGMNVAIVKQYPANATTNGQIVIQFVTVADNAKIDGIEVIPGSAPLGIAAVNAGGSYSGIFAGDRYLTAGASTPAESGGSSIASFYAGMNVAGVSNPAPLAVYETQRYGNFTYTIPGFAANSVHTVYLHFSEDYFSAAKARVFNVSINGQQELTNFDIFAAAGGSNIAMVKQFVLPANSSGQYAIQFTSLTNFALVDGIEIQ